jgi:hypothetical protein
MRPVTLFATIRPKARIILPGFDDARREGHAGSASLGYYASLPSRWSQVTIGLCSTWGEWHRTTNVSYTWFLSNVIYYLYPPTEVAEEMNRPNLSEHVRLKSVDMIRSGS